MPMQSAPRTTVLIVDDTPQNLTVLGELLHSQYRVRAVNSGERALRAATTDPRPEIILLDVMMPGMDGHEVLRRLRATPQTRDIPVIFITAMNGSDDEEQGLALGAVDYIAKPFNPSIVLARVRTHLELKHARDRLATENERLDAEVSRRMRENALIQDLAMNSLANLAEIRDMETGHHIVRTQRYVELLAHELSDHPRFRQSLAGDRLEMIVRAAPLHDIGKVGIPDAILLKPGRLDSAEFSVMKTHAAIGAEAIGKAMTETLAVASEKGVQAVAGAFEFMRVAQEIARSHHEKWDGSGYPEGIAGEEIPVSARLMALADVFDALICRRVYKAPLPVEQTMDVIIKGRGTHFDPDVVDAFLRVREEFIAVARRYVETDEPQPAVEPSDRVRQA